ncbi:DUF262 domain-containing protein [Olsenella sp. HMSC062G07]|uniref:DUF262 domain-containing protein n=1 Tax=Olsenella sp. HMSC062G07 TaxID=1739330 RepID=UPI0008A2B844|nr:DUF262 domain-containing protein [Olsenella sp. HMSC062G07]OFK23660.1 hypothetical protein HMPREF2826_03950 [Olsenella sp. HMSC062G07]
MSKLNIDQKTVKDLLAGKNADFLIPDYQRPYAWGEDECATLWDDLRSFAFPDNNSEKFDPSTDEYFLGPIVTFKNDTGQQEIIDGQQRLTTILLLLRAFYDKFKNAQDSKTVNVRKMISSCIWKTDEFGDGDMEQLKIDSEVASDDDKGEFLSILKKGAVTSGSKSAYAENFLFFQGCVDKFTDEFSTYVALFATRILNNVILLPIEAESQGTALRIFSTLNDRGLPLADADIFKSQFYKHFSAEGRKDDFVARWKRLEETSGKIFRSGTGTPMDELFTRYMYYRRACLHIHDTTTQSLRDFFSTDSYRMLKDDQALVDLEDLLDFWARVDAQEGFSDRVLRRLFVLGYAPNSMWTYLLSVWFLANQDEHHNLDEPSLYSFLNLITAFIFAYTIERPGVNALRSPVYPQMENIVDHKPVTFDSYKFDRDDITARFKAFAFTNQRRFTRSMLVWWAYSDDEQELLSPDTVLEVEHIYARKRNQMMPLANKANLEALGNKAMLEKRINIRASDYRFLDKKKYYLGYTTDSGVVRQGTGIRELRQLAQNTQDFTESDIEERTGKIIDAFVDYLGNNGLLQ